MLQNVRVASGGKVAWLEIGLELRRKHQASADDTQSFLNLLLLLKDAEVVCLFREDEPDHTRVSMKSKGKIIINKVAMEVGGGGHEFAAGCSLEGSFEKSVKSMIQKLSQTIDHYDRYGK